jgi:hypothetical protein
VLLVTFVDVGFTVDDSVLDSSFSEVTENIGGFDVVDDWMLDSMLSETKNDVVGVDVLTALEFAEVTNCDDDSFVGLTDSDSEVVGS